MQRPRLGAHALEARPVHLRPVHPAHRLDPRRQVRIEIRRFAPQHISLGEEGRDLTGQTAFTSGGSGEHEMREARGDAERRHGMSVRGSAPVAGQRAEVGEQRTPSRERSTRWRVHPSERAGIADSRTGELKGQCREIGLEDLRHRAHGKGSVFSLAPEPHTAPRRHASGPSAPLVCRLLRDAHRGEPRHPAARVEARDA